MDRNGFELSLLSERTERGLGIPEEMSDVCEVGARVTGWQPIDYL